MNNPQRFCKGTRKHRNQRTSRDHPDYLNIETESQIITSQNNAIRTNYIKTKVDNIQENRKRWNYKSRKWMQQTCTKWIKEQAELIGKGDPRGTVQKVNVVILINGIYTNQKLFLKMKHKILWDFEIRVNYPILPRRPNFMLINKKKRTCHLVDFVVPTEHRMKRKESKKIVKY